MPDNDKTNKERLQEITSQIEAGIQELFASDKYKTYLQTMSRFHRYSFNNTMLIYLQKPDATLVAGYNKWKNSFERNVKRGEHGIQIIAPMTSKRTVEREKRDPDTGVLLLDAEGKPIMETSVVAVPYFKPVKVFDVSQTEGKELPQLASTLTGKVENYEAFLEAVRRTSPVPVVFRPLHENEDGFFSLKNQEICIREGMSEVQTVCALIHEMTHATLHNAPQKDEKPKSRKTEEVEAESVSYAVCAYYGIETGENSFGYIAAWSKDQSLPELKASLETINKTASELISGIDKNYAELMADREKEAKAQEQPIAVDQKMDAPEKLVCPPPDSVVTAASMQSFGFTDENFLPLTQQRALELQRDGLTVYLLYEGNSTEIAADPEDIREHEGMFGVTKEDWEAVCQRGEPLASEKEKAFLADRADGYALYRPIEQGSVDPKEIDRNDFRVSYLGILPGAVPPMVAAEKICDDLSLQSPPGYVGEPPTTGDILAIRQRGRVFCYLLDGQGFAPVPEFIRPENYLKNAEMAMEDDYGMIDGIINNGPKPETVAERLQSGKPVSVDDLAEYARQKRDEPPAPHKRHSVLEQLRQYKEQQKNEPKERKSAERTLP